MGQTIKDYQVGDVILIRHRGFLPRAIRYFLEKYRKKLDLPEMRLYNHAMMVVEKDGKLQISDSGRWGVQTHDTLSKYINNPNCLHMTWVKPLTDIEKEVLSSAAQNFDELNIKYEFRNFVDNMVYITFGVWIGKKEGKSIVRQYCSEYVAVLMDWVRNTFEGHTWDKNPLDLQICTDLKEVK